MIEKYPIPKYCKKDCIFRDKKAKYMPACQFAFQLVIDTEKGICYTYIKRGAK